MSNSGNVVILDCKEHQLLGCTHLSHEVDALRAELEAAEGQVRHYRYSGNQEGWWVAFMDELGFISIQSDWGDYGHCWSSRGEGTSMRQWISTTMANDRSYVTGKFARGESEIDEAATRVAIDRAIEESDGTASWKKTERALAKATDFSNDEGRREWYDESGLEDKHELMCSRPPQQLLMFMEKVWPHICAAAKADLEANP